MPEHIEAQFDLIARLDDELRELSHGVSAYAGAQSPVLGQRFQLWREAAIKDVRRTISSDAADKFARLPTGPRPMHGETWFDVIGLHHALFVALDEQLELRPDEYPDPETLPKPVAVPAPVEALAPTPLQSGKQKELKEGTLSWLLHNVHYGFWITIGLLIVGAFVAGVRAGQSDGFVRAVAPILQIDKPQGSEPKQP